MSAKPLPSLQFTNNLAPSWTVGQASVAGLGTPAAIRNGVPQRSLALGTNKANNVAGGADTFLVQVLTIVASGTATIDLTSYTDVNGNTTCTMARTKAFWFEILTPTTDSAVVTPATSVDVGANLTNPARLPLGGTTPTYTLLPGDPAQWTTTSAAGLVVDGSHKILLFTNNDSVNAAVVLVYVAGGSS